MCLKLCGQRLKKTLQHTMLSTTFSTLILLCCRPVGRGKFFTEIVGWLVQNATVRLTSKECLIMPLLNKIQLHWLPISYRLAFSQTLKRGRLLEACFPMKL